MRLASTLRRNTPRSLYWRFSHIRLYYYRGHEGGAGNFGDELSPNLIERLFGARVVRSGLGACNLLAIGSILEGAEMHVGDLNPTVWGSGFIKPGANYSGPPLDVRAVRGELTKSRLQTSNKDEIALGDPGILTGLAYPQFLNLDPTYPIGILPHFSDSQDVQLEILRDRHDVKLIDITNPVEQILSDMSNCSLIASSSLHGLIAADSLNIPNVWTQIGNDVPNGRYKFDDYYSAFGVKREPVRLSKIFQETDRHRINWTPLPRFELAQGNLLKAFPLPTRQPSAIRPA